MNRPEFSVSCKHLICFSPYCSNAISIYRAALQSSLERSLVFHQFELVLMMHVCTLAFSPYVIRLAKVVVGCDGVKAFIKTSQRVVSSN